MRLVEAEKKLNKITRKRFGQLFSDEELEQIVRNKGKTGQLLELALGMQLSTSLLDFSDGELKTNKCSLFGAPLETVSITQISGSIDNLLSDEPEPFEQSHLYDKIRHVLYVPVVKDGHPGNWMFLRSLCVDLDSPQYKSLRKHLAHDYYEICKKMKHDVEHGLTKQLHTTTCGYLQIRTKDSKPYHPIYSGIYGRNVANKGFAFYFTKSYLREIRRLSTRHRLFGWVYRLFSGR